MGQEPTKPSDAAPAPKRFGPLPVRAIVYKLDDGKVIATHDFDFNDIEKRKWYNEKLLIWAVHHGHSVELLAESDDGER